MKNYRIGAKKVETKTQHKMTGRQLRRREMDATQVPGECYRAVRATR